MSLPHKLRFQGLDHCSAKADEILAGPLSDGSQWPDDRRWWLQLGFNLGRFSELSGEGRTVWDNWKEAIETKDFNRLEQLVKQMKDLAVEENLRESD